MLHKVFRIPNKVKNVAAAASLAGIATGLGGLAKERIDKHNNIMDKAKTIGHNRKLFMSWIDAGKRYSADLNSRYNDVATPEFLHALNDKKGTPGYTKLLDMTVKPYVRDYSKQKTASLDVLEPSWATDARVLSVNNIYREPGSGWLTLKKPKNSTSTYLYDDEDPYFTWRDVRDEFARQGENGEPSASYKKDYQQRVNAAITPKAFKKLQAARINALDNESQENWDKYNMLLTKTVKPWARDYSKQKTAAIKDYLSDTVYQPKDPYLKKFYTGEISSNDVDNYIADASIYKDKDLEDTVPSEYRHLGEDSLITGDYNAPMSKHHKLRNAASIPLVAGMFGMYMSPFAMLAGKGLKTLATGAGLTALGAAGLKLADKLEPKSYTNLVENISTDKRIQDFEADRLVAEKATPWLLSHPRDDFGFLSERDEDRYFRTFKPKSKPYVRSFNVKKKTAALAEELNPVPKPKRDRSAFQRVVDTLSTNKAKHVGGAVGGVAGMLAGRELLHSTTPEIGAIGIVGGAALGAKNIYGLYNDYFN